MSVCSETDSEPELELATVSSLTAFARLSATRRSQATLCWAVDTLTTLDFRLLREDTALHGLVQDCASTILTVFDDVLQQDPAADSWRSFIPDVASILRSSFLHLLFQYRRLFRVIATRDCQPGSAPPAVVCWVDLVLAKLGDLVAFIAAGLEADHPDRSLPQSLRSQREEDNLRAAVQLPDSMDILPCMLSSERASIAAKRLTVRLMMGRYILCPVLSGQGVDNTIHGLLSTTAEFLTQSTARVDELRFVLGPGLEYLMQQERLTSAMAVSLFAAADMAQGSTANQGYVAAFRPQTMAAAMQLLRFVLRDGHLTQTNILCPLDDLDAPTSVIIRWGVVPQWAWNIWSEYRTLHADTIISLTTTYIQHQRTSLETLMEASDLVSSDGLPNNQAAVISVIIDLVYRFISALSADRHPKQLPTAMMSILDGSCRLISQWIREDTCGIRNSIECCKALIILFGYLSLNGRHPALNGQVLECLASMREQCTCDGWKAATEDNKCNFAETLDQSLIQTKALLSLSQDDAPEFSEIRATQLMQFLVVIMAKGVQPTNLEAIVEFIEAVGKRVLEAPQDGRELLCETLLTCLASANLSGIDLPFSKVTVVADEEVIWDLGLRSKANLFLSSALSLYIASGLVSVDSLTYLEGLEHLLDTVLLICSRHYSGEDEPLGLVVLPMICDAVAHLLEHMDDTTAVYVSDNPRISAVGSALRSIGNRDESMCDRFGTLLKRKISAAAKRLLREIEGEMDQGERKRAYELLCCTNDGISRLLYVVA